MNLKTLDGVRTGVIYGMPYVAESLIRRLGPDEVVVVFDGGRSKFRNELLPSYKARDKKLGFDAEDFHRQKDVGKELFKTLGLRIAWKKGMEADDIITMISRRYSKRYWDVVIVSGDKDFNQLLTPYKNEVQGEISIYNTSKAKVITYGGLKSLTGYTPNSCVDYLALTGDKSDNIGGYPGLGPVRTLALLDKFGSVDSFLRSEEKFGRVDKSNLEEIWKLNKKLIDLKYFYRKFLMKEAIPWENPKFGFDEKKLKKLCGTYEINSFLKPQFINTFKTIGK